MKDVHNLVKQQNKDIKAQLSGKPISVSDSVGFLAKEFDKVGMSKKCSERDADNPEGKYYNMSPKQIIESWELKASESRKYGKLLDSYSDLILNESACLEEWKLDNSVEYDKRLSSLCEGFDQFYNNVINKTDYKYVTREEQMYIKSNKTGNYINGRFDCLFYSESLDRYLLIDWKTNEEIAYNNKFSKLYGPLFDKDDCDLNKYTVQVYMYKKALSEIYNVTTPDKIDVLICQFHDNLNGQGINFKVHKPGFDYNSGLLDDIIDFAYKKKEIKNKKEEI